MNEKVVLKQHYQKLGLEVFLSPMEDRHLNHLIDLVQDSDLIDSMGYQMSVQEGNIDEFIQLISAYALSYSRPSNPLVLGIFQELGGLPIGYGVLKSFNMKLLTAEVGLAILDPKYRNRGHGRLALQRLVAYAFQDLKLQTIGAAILWSNTYSINMCKKTGFSIKEILYNSWMMPNGEMVDMVVMEIDAVDF